MVFLLRFGHLIGYHVSSLIYTISVIPPRIAYIYIDGGRILDIPECIHKIASKLKKYGLPLKTFDQRYLVFRQKKGELEADPDKPQNTVSLIGSTIFDIGINLLEKGLEQQLGGTAYSLSDKSTINKQALAAEAGQWLEFIVKKISNKDEIKLLLRPVEVLSCLFWQDLQKVSTRSIVFSFDHYEQAPKDLEDWIKASLELEYGDSLPNDVLFVISGRDSLSPVRWQKHLSKITPIKLEPFSNDETRGYLASKDIKSPGVIERIIDSSGNLPLLVALLANSHPNSTEEISDTSETAVDCFLNGVDPVHRRVALYASIPRFFNYDILSQLLLDDIEEDSFKWLREMPFVQKPDHYPYWVYHPVVRKPMVRSIHHMSPSKWKKFHESMQDYYSIQLAEYSTYDWKSSVWQTYQLEQTYHSLCVNYENYLRDALKGFLITLREMDTFAIHWAKTIKQAGEDLDFKDGIFVGELFIKGINSILSKSPDNKAIEMFSYILDLGWKKKKRGKYKIIALYWRGYVYRCMGDFEQALKDLDQVIELDPDNVSTLVERGNIYYEMESYDKALADVNIAISQAPDLYQAIICRANVYRKTKEFDNFSFR